MSMVLRGLRLLTNANRVIFSPVSGLRCVQSHRDERACRFHSSSICAHGDALRHGSGLGCALPSHLYRGGVVQREALLLPGRGGLSLENRNVLCFNIPDFPDGPTSHLSCQQVLSVFLTSDPFSTQRADRRYLQWSPEGRCDWWSSDQVDSASVSVHNKILVLSSPEHMGPPAPGDKGDSCLESFDR
ncbi:hypothetical protein D5F01_LYC15282 [Larimichthys crocea]|uniref:Uncharacterized protein n=1 Tax=Larimichthys crocea TaxID=215358 RepID=A0A6G0I2P4_LARCR|nr:hypothetical protein D5F01_LYC15282 [Larimichthys crocea]